MIEEYIEIRLSANHQIGLILLLLTVSPFIIVEENFEIRLSQIYFYYFLRIVLNNFLKFASQKYTRLA